MSFKLGEVLSFSATTDKAKIRSFLTVFENTVMEHLRSRLPPRKLPGKWRDSEGSPIEVYEEKKEMRPLIRERPEYERIRGPELKEAYWRLSILPAYAAHGWLRGEDPFDVLQSTGWEQPSWWPEEKQKIMKRLEIVKREIFGGE